MWTINFIAFVLVTFLIGYVLKEELGDVLPVTVGGLILVLYVLALFGDMEFISIIGIASCLIIASAFIIMGSVGRKTFLSGLKGYYLNNQSIVIVLGLLLIFLLTKNHIAYWWDDVNFWDTDVKGLYLLNRFTGKYGNVAPEFGDYPPGIQIIKWCMAKMNPHEYKEGLAYAGYYMTNVIFFLPLLKKIRDKNIFVNILGFICLFLIPGIVNDTWSQGSSADITMGILFGISLICALDMEKHSMFFYYARLAIFMSVLTLTKVVGFEWLAFAILFLIINYAINKEKIQAMDSILGKKAALYQWGAISIPVMFQLSWWINCLLTRRVAKLTHTGIHMILNGYDMSGFAALKINLFIKGFALCPMHTDKSLAIDLSSLALFVIAILMIILLKALGKISSKEFSFYLIFVTATGIISYLIILLGHNTIFAGETQYDTPEVMAISISRYAAPFTIATIMLIIYLFMERWNKKIVLLACALFILATTDYEAAYNCLFGYRSSVEERLLDREAMIDERGQLFVDAVKDAPELWGSRLLYFRDDTSIHWVKDTYISHAVSPVATVYAGVNPANMSGFDIAQAIHANHASYVYMEDVSSLETIYSIKYLMADYMQDGCDFEYGSVYKVTYVDGQMKLIKVIEGKPYIPDTEPLEEATLEETATEAVDEEAVLEDVSLKDIYGEHEIYAGTCLSPQMIQTPMYTDIILEQFNSVTPENAMKTQYMLNRAKSIESGELVVELNSELIKLLDWAKENNLKVRGHNFIWHEQTPAWIFCEDFDTEKENVSREVMLERMESYIRQTFELLEEAGYIDMFYAYDVVNEAITDSGSLRDSKWRSVIGDDYLWYAFYYADKYAPEYVDLYYNDYNEQYKAGAIVRLAETLVDEDGNSLIDGIGLQAHLYTGDDLDKYLKALDKLSESGLKIEITELDVALGTWQNMLEGTEVNLETQGNFYNSLIKGIVKRVDEGSLKLDAITFWGFADNLSWRKEAKPLLYSGDAKPKYSYYGAAMLR